MDDISLFRLFTLYLHPRIRPSQRHHIDLSMLLNLFNFLHFNELLWPALCAGFFFAPHDVGYAETTWM